MGSGSLLYNRGSKYLTLRPLGEDSFIEITQKVFLDWIGAHGNLVRMRGLWRVFVSVMVASQPGKYILESPGMGYMESKIVQRLCIWTNSLLVIQEFQPRG